MNLTLSFGVIAASHPRAPRRGPRLRLTRMALPIAIPQENFARDAPIPFAQPAVVVHHPGTSEFWDARDQAVTAVRDALKAYGVACACGMSSVGDSIPVQTGECAGPISDGLNVRFDVYQPRSGPMSYSSLWPPDLNIAQGEPSGHGSNRTWPGITFAEYQAGSPSESPATGHEGVTERRILVLPITHVQDWPTGSSGTVAARGFGAFFMRNQAIGTNGDIKLEYTGENVAGITGGTGTSNIVTPVLYR